MILTKLILKTIIDNHGVDCRELSSELEDRKANERLAFLCKNGYVEQIDNKCIITDRGKQVVDKLP